MSTAPSSGASEGAVAAAPEPDILDTPEAGSRMIRGSILRVAGYVAGTLVGLVSSAFLFRHLGVIDGGRYVTVLALTAIVAGVSDLGLTGIGVREYSVRTRLDRDRFMRDLLGMRTALTAFGVVVAVGFALGVGYTTPMVIGTALAGLGLVLFIVQQTLSTPLSVQLRLGWITALLFMAQAAMAALVLLLVLADAGLVELLAVQVPVMVPLIAINVYLVRDAMPIRPAYDRARWLAVLRSSLAYSAAVIFTVLYFRIVTVSMPLLSTSREAGYFGVAFRVVDALALVPPLLVSSAFPIIARAARDDHDRLRYASGRLFEGMLLVGAWVALCTIVGAETAIDVLGGPEFQPAADVLRVLGVALLGTFILAPLGYLLLSLGEHRAILVSNAGAFVLSCALGGVLIPLEGAMGGAVALAVAELGLALAYLLSMMRRRPELKPRLRGPGLCIGAAAVSGAVALVSGLASVPATALASVLYFGLATAFGAVPRELFDAFWGRRPT